MKFFEWHWVWETHLQVKVAWKDWLWKQSKTNLTFEEHHFISTDNFSLLILIYHLTHSYPFLNVRAFAILTFKLPQIGCQVLQDSKMGLDYPQLWEMLIVFGGPWWSLISPMIRCLMFKNATITKTATSDTKKIFDKLFYGK